MHVCLFVAVDRVSGIESVTQLQNLTASSSVDPSAATTQDTELNRLNSETLRLQSKMSPSLMSSLEPVVIAVSDVAPELPSVSLTSSLSLSSSATAAKPNVVNMTNTEVTQLRRRTLSSSAGIDVYTEELSDVETIYSVQVQFSSSIS